MSEDQLSEDFCLTPPGSGGAVVSLEVSDWDAMIERLSQHDIPWQVGPVQAKFCRGGIVTDPDGNRIMFHQQKAPPK